MASPLAAVAVHFVGVAAGTAPSHAGQTVSSCGIDAHGARLGQVYPASHSAQDEHW
jgi:hypothetical protein